MGEKRTHEHRLQDKGYMRSGKVVGWGDEMGRRSYG